MNIEAICTGKTVEEALAKAYEELGANSDNSEFEILERPARKLFGLKIIPAKVKVTMQVADPKPAPQPKTREAAPAPAAQQRPAPRQNQAPAASAPKPANKPQQPVSQPAKPKEAAPVAQAAAPAKPAAPAVPAKPIEQSPEAAEKVACAQEYLRKIFEAMDIASVEIKTNPIQDGAVLTLSGEGLGVLIGRRGETLDALQYLAGLVANRLEGDYFRITIDSGNYREKRERTLEQLAKKLSAQVIKNGRNMTLEPMNPYERRIIHATVQNIEGVTSSSVGEEPNRRVIISSTTQRRKSPPRDGGRKPAPNGGNRGRQQGGPRPPRDGKPHEFRKNTNTAAVVTKPNAFAESMKAAAPKKRIDDSQFEIEPPVRTAAKSPAAPKASEPKKAPLPEAKDKPLYSKIDID